MLSIYFLHILGVVIPLIRVSRFSRSLVDRSGRGYFWLCHDWLRGFLVSFTMDFCMYIYIYIYIHIYHMEEFGAIKIISYRV